LYAPWSKLAPLAAEGPAPEKPLGPEAVSVQALAWAVPPLSFTTSLTSVSFGATSSFVIVHVLCSPGAMVPAQSAEAAACA
jgi:hypothetical protein